MICAKTRHDLLKEFKGKYFTHNKKGKLYKVTGLIFCTRDDRWKIKYKEIMVKMKWNSLAGDYRELAPNNIIEFQRAPRVFRNKMSQIHNKALRFKIARLYDIHGGIL